MISGPLLTTKLFVPPPRLNLVPRPRLIRRLDEGLCSGHRLTLLSAPAGFGKTTLLSDWIGQQQGSVAWLSLDDQDNEITRFWTYLVAALQTVHADLGQEALHLLQSSQPPSVQVCWPRMHIRSICADISTTPNAMIVTRSPCTPSLKLHYSLAFKVPGVDLRTV